MNYIILNKFGYPSIKTISKLMKVDHRIVSTKALPVFTNEDKIIRWATSYDINTRGAKVYNKKDSISLACNKGKSRMYMQKKGVSVPDSWDKIEYATFPYIARPNHHRKGEGFYVVENVDDAKHLFAIEHENVLMGNMYYSKIIDKTNEYRVHVAHGKILLIHEKPLREGEIRGNQHITGLSWGNVLPWNSYKKKMCALACDAVKCIGLDCGAVDIIKGRDKNYYVCEINMAPTLNDSPYSVQRYAKYFDWLFSSKDKRKWWEYKNYTIGSSFAWKNNQLNVED